MMTRQPKDATAPPATTKAGRSMSRRARGARRAAASMARPDVSVDTMYIVEMFAPFVSVSLSQAVPL